MNENKLKYKLENFERAISRLLNSLERAPHLDDLYLDGIIHRFKLVYNLSENLIKEYLEYMGIEVTASRDVLRQAFKNGVLEDATKWIKMMENRKRTSYAYNLDTAWEIYEKVKEEYIYLFKEFYELIKLKIEECK